MLRCGKCLILWKAAKMVRRTTSNALPRQGTFCIVGGLLSAGEDPRRRPGCHPDRRHGEAHGRFPIGNGHAPGIDTGRGASGAESSAAGWVAWV